ncbi:Hypothetical predicted protein [Octopus vulgaris]|uniref:Helitron helicase-like domain-containing protein n=1 Tax=Octopus vulgaris TaxID=6645 RepID=A0AA36B8X9_OCTVU|nr:Hypothetical predicted protein [Octopus vulgaris]
MLVAEYKRNSSIGDRNLKALQTRAEVPENINCLQSVMEKISSVMLNNPYTAAYLNMRTVEQEEKGTARENANPKKVTMHFISGPDARRYNNPVHNEIAAVFVGEDGALSVHPQGVQRQQISYLSLYLDRMIYPILLVST